MRRLAYFLVFVLSLGLGLPAASRAASDVTGGVGASRDVDVRDVQVEGSVVKGVVVNNSSQTLREVHLVIRNAWLWKDERNPGANNPSHAEFYTLPGEVAAGGSVPFSHRVKAMSQARSDGRFLTSVEVMSYSLVGR